jgi:hypothetical protein
MILSEMRVLLRRNVMLLVFAATGEVLFILLFPFYGLPEGFPSGMKSLIILPTCLFLLGTVRLEAVRNRLRQQD